MKENNFLATFGSDEPVARALYLYQIEKKLLKRLSLDLEGSDAKKVSIFFEKLENSLEKEFQENFPQGDNLAIFGKIKQFIKNNE